MVALVVFTLQNEPPRHAQAQLNNEKPAVAVAETTVKAPAPTPVVTQQQVTPPVVPISCEVYRPIIEKYNWDIRIAMQIMDAESSGGLDGICYTKAVGDTRVIGGIYAPSCGLFQVRTLPGRPTCEQLHDPETNVAYAYKLYQGRPSWVDWSVCKGIVRCY